MLSSLLKVMAYQGDGPRYQGNGLCGGAVRPVLRGVLHTHGVSITLDRMISISREPRRVKPQRAGVSYR